MLNRICREPGPSKLQASSSRLGSPWVEKLVCRTFPTLISPVTISLLAVYFLPPKHSSGFSSPVAHDTPMVSNFSNAFARKCHPLPPWSALTLDRRIGYWPKSFSPARECWVELLQKHTNKHLPPRNTPPPPAKTTLPRCTTSPPRASP